MTYIINRLIKTKNREGDDEIFIELSITDDLGIYNYGKWILNEDLNLIKNEFGNDFGVFNTLNDLTEDKIDKNKLIKIKEKINIIVDKHLLFARKQYEKQLLQEEFMKNNPNVLDIPNELS